MEAGPSYVHISQREILHKLSELTRHIVLQKTNEKTKKKQHARFPEQVPASSVSRSPGGNNRQEREGRSARPRRRETSSRQPRGQNRSTWRKKSAVFRNVWRQNAMVPWEWRTHCSIARLAKRLEGYGGQHLADFAIPTHAVNRSYRAWRNKRLPRGVFMRYVR